MQYDISDNELIYLYRCDNELALDILTKRYKQRIYGLIERVKNKYGIKRMEFDDYYQTSYIAFLKCIERFDDTYIFYNYIMQAVENVLIREVEKEKKYNSILSLDIDLINEGYSFTDVINDSTSLYEKNIIWEFIGSNFDELSTEIIKCRENGYTGEEIAKILNVSKKVVYNRLGKIKKVLKSDLYH